MQEINIFVARNAPACLRKVRTCGVAGPIDSFSFIDASPFESSFSRLSPAASLQGANTSQPVMMLRLRSLLLATVVAATTAAPPAHFVILLSDDTCTNPTLPPAPPCLRPLPA